MLPIIVGLAVLLLVCGGVGGLYIVYQATRGDMWNGNEPVRMAPRSPAATRSSEPTAAVTTEPPEPAEPAAVKVPDVVGKNAAVAKDELERAGFNRVELGSTDKTSQLVVVPANWTVTEQSAAAGKPLDPGALIVLTCTKNR